MNSKMYNYLNKIIKSSVFKLFITLGIILNLSTTNANAQQAQSQYRILNKPINLRNDFNNFKNTYFLADSLSDFNPKTGKGKLIYKRHEFTTSYAFNNMQKILVPSQQNAFPADEYEQDPSLTFEINFISPYTVRLQSNSNKGSRDDKNSLMLDTAIVEKSIDWEYQKMKDGYKYVSSAGYKVIIEKSPWKIKFLDQEGKVLTHTVHKTGVPSKTFTPVMPFSFVERASDLSKSFNAAFALSAGEKIYGGGESFTQLNKRGQKVNLSVNDAYGSENKNMYKPVPYFMSSRGYGMFIHTSSPITADIGNYSTNVNSLMIGDSKLDMFISLGSPKKLLDEYTNLTGKASMPPLWSFGFWMSRITYTSEKEGREVVNKLRDNNIPCDVLHFDTGWFENNWRCDYEFSNSRFSDPEKMIEDFKNKGIHVSLWQNTYFTPKNDLFPEIVDKDLYIKDNKGNVPTKDAILDFSNEETINWYQNKLSRLLKMGVGAIKADFGEAAPYNGVYASGKTGFYEHNLYPLRYNKVVSDITREVTGNSIIWARSAWAGSQRYPVHWGGDAASTNVGMAASLRGGLSLGISGFSFWSHDMGGFVSRPSENLYKRWAAFGMLSSHSRSHGTPPKEPWHFSNEFMDTFRLTGEMRYKLMPYIFTQAKKCTETGLPMVRALFIEFPNDKNAWNIDDQYLFGDDIMVAPMFDNSSGREVYLPGGKWIDYQTGKEYDKGWHKIDHGRIPAIILVKKGSVIPHIKLAQSTMFMDWSEIKLITYGDDKSKLDGELYLPDSKNIRQLEVKSENGKYELENNSSIENVEFKISSYDEYK